MRKRGKMLGKTVYFLNFKDKKVDEGIIIEAHISTGGYESYLLQTEKGDKQIERSVCYATREKAEQALIKKQPVADKMNDIASKTTKRIDSLRERLLGKAPLKHLARR